MRPEHLNRTHFVDGRRVVGRSPGRKNGQTGTFVYLDGLKAPRFFAKGITVDVTGYREALPAGPVRPDRRVTQRLDYTDWQSMALARR